MTRLSRIVSLGCLCVLLAAKPSQSAEGERLILSDIVCENDIWNRKCLNRSVLSIETVDYKVVTGSYICNRNNSVQGNPCPSVDKTSLVKKRCNGKNQCNLPAEKSTFENPCPGVETAASIYLEIFFACVEPASTTSPTTQPRKPTSKKPISKMRVSSTSVSETLSTSATTANPDSSDVIKSPEPFSGQTTTSKYRKPQPCTTKREIITFNPDNEPAISEGSSQLRGLQNAQVMFVIALLLMACQAFCMSD